MKLLIVTQYFWPEFFVINRLSQKLTEQGHQVTVATGKPNYPEGVVYEGYRQNGIQFESFGQVEVIRIPLRPRGKGGLGLFLNYLSFVYSGIRHLPRLLENRDFDAILVYAPSPITSTIPAILLKKKLGVHLALWVQDLWPESLSATGYIKNRFVIRLVVGLVKWIYSNVDTLLGQSRSFVEQMSLYAGKEKIFYYPNAIEKPPQSDLMPPDKDVSCFERGFSVVFAGNIGKAQSIPTIIDAAGRLAGQGIEIIIVGDGSMLEWAQSKVEERGLPNVHFLGRVDNSYMPWIYSQSNALLVSLTDEKIFSYTIPAKVQACLAAARPIVASINGEAAKVISDSGAGLTCRAEDPDALAQSIAELRAKSDKERAAMGRAGYQYFLDNFEMDNQARNLVDLLEKRTAELARG